MMIYFLFLISSFVFLTSSALFFLYWAIRNGEFSNSKKLSLQIFDEEEPVGRLGDRFPGLAVTESDDVSKASTELSSSHRNHYE